MSVCRFNASKCVGASAPVKIFSFFLLTIAKRFGIVSAEDK